MKKFIIKSGIFLVALLVSFYLVFMQANGKSDAFYKRFTSPKQTSLVLGTSKAAQGLQPEFLNSYLNRKDIYNFSFTIAHSPYGPTYLESIKQKLKPETKNGIFILTVDSWSISSDREDPNDTAQFSEANGFLATTYTFDSDPNISYLMKSYKENYIKILQNFSPMYLHDDGWLEVSVKLDSTKVDEKIKHTSESQKERLKNYTFSKARLDYLKKTITFLKKHGNVYLVRLPVYKEMTEIEDVLIPDFDAKMQQLSYTTSTPYFNMKSLNSKYTYIDGNHLQKESGKDVSLEIAKWIKEKQNRY